jgi:hypothetical protein
MGYAKMLVSYRLSDSTRDNVQEATQLRRRVYELEDMGWMASRCNRTDIIEQAVDHFLTYLRQRVKELEAESKKGAKRKK